MSVINKLTSLWSYCNCLCVTINCSWSDGHYQCKILQWKPLFQTPWLAHFVIIQTKMLAWYINLYKSPPDLRTPQSLMQQTGSHHYLWTVQIYRMFIDHFHQILCYHGLIQMFSITLHVALSIIVWAFLTAKVRSRNAISSTHCHAHQKHTTSSWTKNTSISDMQWWSQWCLL